jgi:hypothetical protein
VALSVTVSFSHTAAGDMFAMAVGAEWAAKAGIGSAIARALPSAIAASLHLGRAIISSFFICLLIFFLFVCLGEAIPMAIQDVGSVDPGDRHSRSPGEIFQLG